MASPFTDRVVLIVSQIPPGKVATYGMVAMLAGSPRAARQVGWLLHSLSEKRQLPWHRVVNRHGAVSLHDGHNSRWQRILLEDEGVVFGADGRIDLARYLWRPPLDCGRSSPPPISGR